MSDKDDEFLLRDKFAIEILTCMCSMESRLISGIMSSFHDTHSDKDADASAIRYANSRFEAAARSAYKMADIMRKIRLQSFT